MCNLITKLVTIRLFYYFIDLESNYWMLRLILKDVFDYAMDILLNNFTIGCAKGITYVRSKHTGLCPMCTLW